MNQETKKPKLPLEKKKYWAQRVRDKMRSAWRNNGRVSIADTLREANDMAKHAGLTTEEIQEL